jgi:hypothetical protein
LDQDLLKEQCSKAGLTGDSYPSVREAYRSARAHAYVEDMIFVGGSTFKTDMPECDRRFNSHPIPPPLIPTKIIGTNQPFII